MKSIASTFVALAFAFAAFAQTTTTTYSKDENFRKEVPAEKAKFAKTVTKSAEGLLTIVVKDLQAGKIVSSQSYKNLEPVGTWVYRVYKAGASGTDTLNYNFALKYENPPCKDDSITGNEMGDPFTDNPAIGYKAPKLTTGEASIIQYLVYHIIYPVRARENDIQGRVYVNLKVNRQGVVENVTIQKSADVTLDKEAARVIREMRFLPAMLKGEPKSFCMMLPVVFKLQ